MINNNKNSFSSDAVKFGKLQIWPINHKVLQTPSYLSPVAYAENFRGGQVSPQSCDLTNQL